MNPKKPECPVCRSLLTKNKIIETIRYDQWKCSMNIYVCWCGAATGVVVMDNPNPDDPYIVQRIQENKN
jgi:hypothetical protein